MHYHGFPRSNELFHAGSLHFYRIISYQELSEVIFLVVSGDSDVYVDP